MNNNTFPPESYDNQGAPATVGIGRKVAYALAALNLDVIQRKTIRALLPAGPRRDMGLESSIRSFRTGKQLQSYNLVSKHFGYNLRKYEDWGWITRGHILVAVHDRGALLDHAMHGLEQLPPRLLELQQAIDQIHADEAEAADDRLIEQRRKELKALMRLMQAPVTGVNRSGTKSVRFVNRSRVI